jgi:hypothetical protein
VLEPTCEREITGECANTYVTVTSSDWLGCDNQNTAQKSFYVRFDDEAPDVTVTLGEFLTSESACAWMDGWMDGWMAETDLPRRRLTTHPQNPPTLHRSAHREDGR